MLPVERQNRILEIVASKQAVSVEDLCHMLYSSGATIRRDLAVLETNGLLRRTHGGAVSISGGASDFPMMMRESENTEKKALIAAKAIRLIRNGQTLFMDSSSTVCALATRIAESSHLRDIRVITNGLKTATILSKAEGIRVFMTGGALRDNAMSLVGVGAQEFAAKYHANWAFISCRGISPITGITDANEEEAALKTIYLRNADEMVVLADSSKLGKQFFCKLTGIDGVGRIICDQPLPEEYGKKDSLA